MSKRPAPIVIGPIRAYATRAPTPTRPRWYWRAVRHEAGAQVPVWAGRATKEEVLATIAVLVARGEHDRPTRGSSNLRTVEDLLRAYTTAASKRPDLAERTVRNYIGSRKRLQSVIGDVDLRSLGVAQLERYRDTQKRAGKGDRTTFVDLGVLEAAWKWARERGGVPPHDLGRIRKTSKPASVYNHHTPSERQARIAIDRLTGWRRDAAELLFRTGARAGEIAALRPEDFDAEARELTLGTHRGAQKTGERTIPIDVETLEILRRLAETRKSRLWPTAAPGFAGQINAGLRYVCKAADLPRFTCHGFRRLMVDRLQDAGVDVGTAAMIMGHSPAVMLAAYRRPTPRNLRNALERVSLEELDNVRNFPAHQESQ